MNPGREDLFSGAGFPEEQNRRVRAGNLLYLSQNALDRRALALDHSRTSSVPRLLAVTIALLTVVCVGLPTAVVHQNVSFLGVRSGRTC